MRSGSNRHRTDQSLNYFVFSHFPCPFMSSETSVMKEIMIILLDKAKAQARVIFPGFGLLFFVNITAQTRQ